jgi:hypothetical protein
MLHTDDLRATVSQDVAFQPALHSAQQEQRGTRRAQGCQGGRSLLNSQRLDAGLAQKVVNACASDCVPLNEHLEHPRVRGCLPHACKMGLEGIVSKWPDSRYRYGRSPDWLKLKNPKRLR